MEKDQPTLDMAKAWGLTISAVGNHEFDRGVADFNNRIADPSNGIDWLCANTSAANKSPDGLLSHVRDSTIRTVNGKWIGFVGALTDALGSVATPQITRDADLDERAVDAINRVARELKRSGKVDAVVALLHADASAAADIGRDVDVVYTGHSHAIKRGTTAGGAPIYEAGSFGRNMAVQDLIITGAGRRATVRVPTLTSAMAPAIRRLTACWAWKGLMRIRRKPLGCLPVLRRTMRYRALSIFTRRRQHIRIMPATR